MNARQMKAVAKRQRKAAVLNRSQFAPTTPTGSEGAEFARAGMRRMDRRARAKRLHEGSATAARQRLSASREDSSARRTRTERKTGKRALSPVPQGFFGWEKKKRRDWTNGREIARQQAAMDALVRRGVPAAEARRQFGSL